jgi:hypothetical protein
MSFGEYLYVGGFIQKTTLGPLSYTQNKQTSDNMWFNPQKLWKTTLEGSKRHHNEAWAETPPQWAGWPIREATQPSGGPLALYRLVLLPTIYTVDSKAVLGRFIQRWSREVTRIDDMVEWDREWGKSLKEVLAFRCSLYGLYLGGSKFYLSLPLRFLW